MKVSLSNSPLSLLHLLGNGQMVAECLSKVLCSITTPQAHTNKTKIKFQHTVKIKLEGGSHKL